MDLPSENAGKLPIQQPPHTDTRKYMPPRWALGYHEAYDGLPSPHALVEVARRFQHSDTPLESLQIVPTLLSSDRSSPAAASNEIPEEVARELHSLGIKTGRSDMPPSDTPPHDRSLDRQNMADEHRPFLFTHSLDTDIPSYAAPSFPVRVSSAEDLRRMLKNCLDLSDRGFSLYGPELHVPDEGVDNELVMRWIQLAVLLPLLRVHFSRPQMSSAGVWPFPSSVENLWRRYLGLRYKLLPYLYGTLDQYRRTGTPPVHLPASMSETLPAGNPPHEQFLLGSSLLVAPLLTNNTRERSIHLPHGTWFHFWTNRQWQGPQSVRQRVPLERIPLYARGGGIIPLHPYMRRTDEYQPRTLVLRTYPNGSQTSEVYFDDGHSFAFLTGDYHRLRIRTRQQGDSFSVSIEREGSRPLAYEHFEWQLPLSSAEPSVMMDEYELPGYASPEEFVAADEGLFEGNYFLRIRTPVTLKTLQISTR